MTYVRRTRPKVIPVDVESEVNGNSVEVVYPEDLRKEERVKQFVKRHPTQDLGWCFARYNEDKEMLTIASPPDYSQTPEIPGQFLEIHGKPNIHSLLHFIKRILYPNQDRERG
jgi:hypothetical protein